MLTALLLIWVGAMGAAQQQAGVQEEELAKPGQTQPAPAQPAPQSQPEPAPSPAPQKDEAPATPRKQSLVLHSPSPEEAERGKAGKPVAAFWVVVPGS